MPVKVLRAKVVSHRNGPPQEGMALKIGVMGGATGTISRAQLNRAHQLGRAIAKSGCVLITGACPGLPLATACGEKRKAGPSSASRRA